MVRHASMKSAPDGGRSADSVDLRRSRRTSPGNEDSPVVVRPAARGVHGTAMYSGTPEEGQAWRPSVPDLFDVITYFRARGDSYALIASVGFWREDGSTKAMSARRLKRWYEAELARRAGAKSFAGSDAGTY
jgi:hypothetical protein